MLSLLRRHRVFFLGFALAGLALRLFFLLCFPAITDDSRLYADLATNWLQHGILGQTESGAIAPTDVRLPGYPAFLALVFALFGVGNFRAVLLIQILFDLGTCLLIADLTRRAVSEKASRVAFALAALCPFLANYSAAALTETLEIFFTTLALDSLAIGMDLAQSNRSAWQAWAGTGAALSACILLRPDGGLLLAAVGLFLLFLLWKRLREGRPLLPMVRAGILVGLVALAPLLPWTVRNWRTLHQFQPLAPRYANGPGELPPLGFIRWVRTWMANYVSVEEIYWAVPGSEIEPDKLPARAFDTPQQRERTLRLIAEYNLTHTITPEVDARFGELADERIQSDRARYFVVLPALRIADMWLRPRTEMLPPDARWWEFNDDLLNSVVAVGFGLLNLAYVAAALVGAVRRRATVRFAGALVGFVVLRTLFLGTLENPEARYTLECYPTLILFAAASLEALRQG